MRRCLLALPFALPLPAAANDSVAGLGAGGVILGRTDAIEMQREDLSISMDEVAVDYEFKNNKSEDIQTIVAFPMPDLDMGPYSMPNLPDTESDNFLDFTVRFDGKDIRPELEQRAFAVGVDITAELAAQGIPAAPYLDDTYDRLAAIPQAVADDWIDRGLIFIDRYDDGGGWKDVRTPLWSLKSTYWWKATFPANRTIKVSHRYKPSVASSVAVSFYADKAFREPYDDYKSRFCFDQSFETAVKKAGNANPDGYPEYSENIVQYVLTSGGNWATGTIGAFRLTIDKGDPRNIVSFCGTGVRKTGPTTFEMSATDFSPSNDIEVLILQPWSEEERGASIEPLGEQAPPKSEAQPPASEPPAAPAAPAAPAVQP
ncbi:MAG: DUF4424 domain-containing protein [Rhizobiaceae bacterium]|nr:DUF4424 domain-containing protein [Rhizobiaceae bacterium]